MKRFTPLGAIACLTIVATLVSAQEDFTTPNSTNTNEDPVAELTNQIMQQLLPSPYPRGELSALTQPGDRVSQTTAAKDAWTKLRVLPCFPGQPAGSTPPWLADVEQRMEQYRQNLPALGPGNAAAAQTATATAITHSASALAQKATSAAMPQAMAISVSDGIYAIEAAVAAEGESKKVSLNGTRAEVLEQIRQLEPAVRKALEIRLGMQR